MIRYTDISMEDFICPLFRGCTICVTGLSSVDRKEVQRLTTEHGGQYTGQLKMNECTHLIVQEPKGRYSSVNLSLKGQRSIKLSMCTSVWRIRA